MNIKRFILVASAGVLTTVATMACAAAPPAAHTVTIPHDASWIPAPSTSAVPDHDTAPASKFHFTSDRPHATNKPPPVDPATVGRMPEDSGSDARVPQGCWINPHQQKCH